MPQRGGSTTTATAIDLFSWATGPRTSICGTHDHADHAESFEYANNGGRKYLFHNRDGT